MANEPDPECTPVKAVMKKVMYKSPLSGIRSTPYKPPVGKSGFKPIGVSSPKLENNSTRERFVLSGEGPQPSLNFNPQQGRPPSLDNESRPTSGQRLDTKPSLGLGLGGDDSVIRASLGGRGGQWRGPQVNDMSPETRRGGKRHGYKSSPASEGGSQWYSPIQNLDGYRGGNDRGSNGSFGRNSFRQNNFGNNSFGSNPHTPNSPRGQFNSSDRSFNSSRNNSRRGNRGGSHGYRSNGDITAFYSAWMNKDPWLDLMRDKMNESSFQSKSSNKGSLSFMNLTSDGEVDEGIASQENETPVGDDSL